MAMRMLFVLVLLVRDAAPLVVAVTHAAGRMGVSVVGQLREIGFSEELGIRAVVRSEAEASRLKLDLCGAVLRNGELRPLLELKEDLGIDLFIVEDDTHEHDGLASAFEGADIAVLLSAAHADFTRAAGGFGQKSASVLPTSLPAPGSSGINVRVPPLSGAAAARRLGAEISAVANAPGMCHVLLRSSMGVGALRCASQTEASDYTQQLAAAAVMRMGGGATIAAQADAEDALWARCVQRGVSFTVLRLGALVDSAGEATVSQCVEPQRQNPIELALPHLPGERAPHTRTIPHCPYRRRDSARVRHRRRAASRAVRRRRGPRAAANLAQRRRAAGRRAGPTRAAPARQRHRGRGMAGQVGNELGRHGGSLALCWPPGPRGRSSGCPVAA